MPSSSSSPNTSTFRPLSLKGLMPSTKSRASRSTAEQSTVYAFPSQAQPARNVKGQSQTKDDSVRKRRLSGLSDGDGARRASSSSSASRERNSASDRPTVRQRTSSQSSVSTIRRMPSRQDLRDRENARENVVKKSSSAGSGSRSSSGGTYTTNTRSSRVPLKVEIPAPSDTMALLRSSNLFVSPPNGMRCNQGSPLTPGEVLNVSSLARNSPSGTSPSGIPIRALSSKSINLPEVYPISVTATSPVVTKPAPAPPVKPSNPLLNRFDLSIISSNKHLDFWDRDSGATLLWKGTLRVIDEENPASARNPRPNCQSITMDCRSVGRDGRHARDTPDHPLFFTEYRGFHTSDTLDYIDCIVQQNGIHIGRDWVVERGAWIVPFWVPLPTDLFAKVETRKFRIRAKMMVAEEGMGGMGKQPLPIPLYSGTAEFTLSHLRTRRYMGVVKSVCTPSTASHGDGSALYPLDDPLVSDGRATPLPDWCLSDYSDDEQDSDIEPAYDIEENGGIPLF